MLWTPVECSLLSQEKAQHNICPPQGSSEFWQYLKHIDLFRVVKLLEKDIPFFA